MAAQFEFGDRVIHKTETFLPYLVVMGQEKNFVQVIDVHHNWHRFEVNDLAPFVPGWFAKRLRSR